MDTASNNTPVTLDTTNVPGDLTVRVVTVEHHKTTLKKGPRTTSTHESGTTDLGTIGTGNVATATKPVAPPISATNTNNGVGITIAGENKLKIPTDKDDDKKKKRRGGLCGFCIPCCPPILP